MGNCQNFKSKDDPIHPTQQNKSMLSLQLIGKTFTWNRDSHGLFDYENKNIYKNVFKMTDECFLIRDKNEVKLIKMSTVDEMDKFESNTLAKIIIQDNNYFVTSDLLETKIGKEKASEAEHDGLHCNSIWIVVKSLKVNKDNRTFKLSQGDYIKLGRIRFRIKEFGINLPVNPDGQKKTDLNSPSKLEIINLDENEPKPRNSQFLCRICLGDNSEIDNPFVTPCKCAGTMQYIHIKCLQMWLKSRLQIKTTAFATSFLWKNFECELCKKVYPNVLTVNDVSYDIVEIPKPIGPYLILEILSRERNQSRGIHVLNMGVKNLIRLGRGHDSEIRIPDISVSRCHAAIKYEKNMFFIEDNASKFGTLVLMKDPVPINLEHNNVALQVGRTVLYFTAKKAKKVFRAFVGGSITKCNSNLTDSSELDLKKREEDRNGMSSPNNPNALGFFDNDNHGNEIIENQPAPINEEPANQNNNINNLNLDDAPEEEPVL